MSDEMKYILITGGTGGMGAAVALRFRDDGYNVIVLDRNEGYEDGIRYIRCDVTDEESVLRAFSEVRGITDNLYAILHFAGIYMLDSLVEMERGEFEKIFKVNLFGVYLVNRTFISLLSKGSKILITTSELAPLDPLPFTGVYAVSKAALDKYAYSLRMELQLLGISVSVLRAGAVDTGMIGVSTDALDEFCKNTGLYSCNAARFKKIVDGVEARRISPRKIAEKVRKIFGKRKPAFAYSINRNPLLLILSALPKRLQFFIIKQILK